MSCILLCLHSRRCWCCSLIFTFVGGRVVGRMINSSNQAEGLIFLYVHYDVVKSSWVELFRLIKGSGLETSFSTWYVSVVFQFIWMSDQEHHWISDVLSFHWPVANFFYTCAVPCRSLVVIYYALQMIMFSDWPVVDYCDVEFCAHACEILPHWNWRQYAVDGLEALGWVCLDLLESVHAAAGPPEGHSSPEFTYV